MATRQLFVRTAFRLLTLVVMGGAASGCSVHGVLRAHERPAALEWALAARAQERRALPEDFPDFGPEDVPERGAPVEREEEAGIGQVILGELIAIFPGMLVPGLGHYYAGDYRTSAQLRRVGGFGLLLTAVGGGIVVGGYFLDQEDLTGYAYSAYGAGGTIGAVGLTYYLTGWIYDIIDTPRAVRSGGRPPPRSRFVESLDFLD